MIDPVNILLIEDDSDDVELFTDALNRNQQPHSIQLLQDGMSAVSWFSETEECPDIVVMDMNLPRLHGRDVIRHIRSKPSFDKVPVVVLTTSSASDDRNYVLSQGATAFIVKPSTLDGLLEMARQVVTIANDGRSATV
jgi:two-component system response regulator